MGQIGVFDAFGETMEQMTKHGILLVSGARGNPMTIGWGSVGSVWGRAVFVVLVRPSRYTFVFMEETREFTVNVLADRYKGEVTLCGTKSGRETNKIEACRFTLEKGTFVGVPHIAEADVYYECKTLHKTSVINADLDGGIVKEYYPKGDYHRVYFGEILGVYRR
jgi:flavin reductase (DIM6/NTAB) family NADH-FMN oxidoreductase RutF